MPSSKEIKRLRDRWTPDHVAEVARVLRGAGPLSPDDVDLRGFPLEKVAHLTAAGVDFSYAKSPLNAHGQDVLAFMNECRLDRCRFDGVAKFHRVNGTFTRCSFARAKGSGGGWTGTFEDCDFTAADLTGCRSPKVVFRRCDFTKAKLARGHFGRCRFEACKFTGTTWGFGSVMGATFAGCDLADVAFKDTARDHATTFDAACRTAGMTFEDYTTQYGVRVYIGPGEPPPSGAV